MSSVYRPFVEKLGDTNVLDFVGNEGEIFYDPTINSLRRSDGVTPGGISMSGGGAGIGYSDLSVITTPPGISTLTYNNLTGLFSYTPQNLTGFTTSGDLVGFTTSGDLTGFTTSGDLVGFTTSGDLVGFTTSGDLVGFTTSGDLVGFTTSGDLVGFLSQGSDGSSLTGIVTSVIAGTGISISQSTGAVTINSTASGGNTRDNQTFTIPSISAGVTTTGTFTLPKAGILISVEPVGITSGWLRLYTRSDLASADASRLRTQDPSPGSGVIFETITAGIATIYLSPQTVFANAEDVPINTYDYRFTKDGTVGITTYKFNYLVLEA